MCAHIVLDRMYLEFLLLYVEIGSHYGAWAHLQFTILLPQCVDSVFIGMATTPL